MWSIVQDKMKAIIGVDQYNTITIDGTSIVDNHNYIVVYYYIIQNRTNISMLILLQKFKVDKTSICSLTSIIVSTLSIKTHLSVEAIVMKLICLSIDGIAAC